MPWWLGVKLVFRTFLAIRRDSNRVKSNGNSEEEQPDEEMTGEKMRNSEGVRSTSSARTGVYIARNPGAPATQSFNVDVF